MIHRPLLKSWLITLISYFAMLFLHFKIFDITFEISLLWISAGLIYTHFFEWTFHKKFMHDGFRIFRRIKISHLEHHKDFYGSNFQSRDKRRLENIIMPLREFPILLCVNYSLSLLLIPKWAIPAFFTGVIMHFLAYETSHWFTHVKDNFFDAMILKIPFIGEELWQFRFWQIRHHMIHHEDYTVNYNFNVPPLGDYIFKTYSEDFPKLKPRR